MTVVNTGSVSQSYDGDRLASYVVIDGDSVSIRRVEYDVESEAKELLGSGTAACGMDGEDTLWRSVRPSGIDTIPNPRGWAEIHWSGKR